MDVLLEKKELISHLEKKVRALADKLRDPKQVESTVINKISMYDIEEISYYYGWSGSDLGNGFSGICCLLAELDKMYPNEGWDVIGHTYLLEIKRYIESQGVHSLSLWGGLTGICFATLALSKNGTRYQNFLEQLHNFLLQNLPVEINRCMEQISKGVKMTDYDVIGGLAGVGRYLLYHQNQIDMRRLLDHILHYLITLTEDKEVNGVKVPGWYIPRENQFLDSEKNQYPDGNFNLGFAHGITGCLAFLSIAKLQGCEVEKQDEAINVIANWLVKWSQEDEFGPLWPKRVSWQEHVLNKSQNKASIYEAWCYGEVGIARSLWLAGVALENEKWKDLSLKTFTGMYHRSKRKYTLISPTYCHGIAGTLHSVQLMLQEYSTEDLLAYREFLLSQLLQHINTDTPFGAKDIEIVQGEQYSFDKPGLLSGSAGIAMVLLQAISKRELEWDSVFLVK
ncbi:Nisin biosynthesis protein NisC [Bacillus rhizoplanae]|uniref:Nisin biosynthesis protein NisC n=1 Tax=Bacillus rhizoplanae TaxID=2880966 RepID=A0ABM8YG34_9BACI|nr:lanthionine synthetase C family protein [Bacillus rhizoplanae]CAG9614798.1 Nisin biosynthesis protein NisC [Bacillus rhizoplanae]